MSEFEPTGALAAAAAHYKALCGQTIEVPEWGTDGKPLVVHFDPITAGAAQKIQARAKGNDARATALAVIVGAKDAAGKPLFEDNGATLLFLENKVDPRVIARIGMAILGVGDRETDLGN